MSRLPEFPPRDPGLPRFVWALAALVLVANLAGLLRPPQPLAAPEYAGAREEAEGEIDPALLGQAVFRDQGCANCHGIAPGEAGQGPNLVGLWGRAGQRIAAPEYRGGARDADSYLREAVLDHCLDPLPGFTCPPLDDLAVRLSVGEVDSLLAFLRRVGGADDPAPGEDAAP